MAKQEMKNNLTIAGFSLVETLVAIGLISVTTLTILAGFEQARKTTKSLEMKLEQIDFVSAFKSEISSTATCRTAFSGVRLPPSSLVNGANINFLPSQITFQGSSLSSYNFDSFSNVSINYKIEAVTAADSATGTLTFNLNPKAQYASYLKLKPVTTTYSVQVDPLGVITNCAPSALVQPTFASNDCQMIDTNLGRGQRTGRSYNCPTGYVMLFGAAVPSGSQDGVNTNNLRITSNSIWVYARRDSWRILAKCCREN